MSFVISEKKRLITLILVIILSIFSAIFTSEILLYNAAYDEHTNQMRLSVNSQKEMIAAVARFDMLNSQGDHDAALAGTLSQVIEAQRNYDLPEDSGEFFILERRGKLFTLIMRHDRYGVVTSNKYGLNGSEDTLPQWLTLVEHDIINAPSGVQHVNSIVMVFNSVTIGGHDFYIISKIDSAEIYAPFINASLITFVVAILVICIGVMIITKQVNPMVRNLNSQIEFNNAILTTAQTSIIITDENDIIQQHNPATIDTFYYQPNELKGSHFSRLVPSFHHTDFNEHKGICGDGRELTIQLAIGKTRVNNQWLHVYIATDISQRKQAEMMIRDSMAKTAAIIDTVKDGILTLNDKGIIKSINPAVERIFGYFCGELEGGHINMLMPDSLQNTHENYISHYLVSGEPSVAAATREMNGLHKDGHVFPLELSVSEFFMDTDRYFTGVVRDITERKLAEQELHNHRNNLEEMVAFATTEVKAIVQTAVNGVISIDQHGIVQIFNPAAEKMFGWQAEDVVGQNVVKIIPTINAATHDGYIDRYLKEGDSHIIGIGREVEALRKDGSTFPAHLAIGHNQLGEDKHLFVAFISDISGQKRAQQELIQAKDNAEEAARVKANFLANMSHEIRTPMNAVIGFSEILLQDKGLSETSHQHVETILNSGKNLLNIINDILDFSKIEAGNISLEHVGFHLANAMNDTLRTLEFKAAEKDLKLICEISSGLPLRVMGDPTRLRQVIINLVGNSIKFTPSGSVTLAIKPAEDGHQILFSITDTGIGMSQTQVDNVFDAFAQADASTNRRFGGTGLGTTISKQIVELMGGKIWAESEEGKGTVFYFTADLDQASDNMQCLFEDGSYVESGYRSPRRFNVLLAEDIHANATLATLRLEQQGHAVTWVNNGVKAVKEAIDGDYDVVLMDIQMPEMDGLVATRKIREALTSEHQYLPIIALTASVMKEDQQDCLDAGMDAIVGKPIDFPELLSTMDAHVPEGVGSANVDSQPIIPAVQQVIDFSPLVGIVDTRKGLDTWNDEIIYAKALVEFAQERVTNGRDIVEHLNHNRRDLEASCAIAHGLKGLAGNLCIVDVAELAATVDGLLKQANVDLAREKANELDRALEIAVNAIGKLQLPDDESPASTKPLDPELAKQLIEQVITALDEINPDVVAPHLKVLSQYIDKRELVAIQHGIDNFDFDEAKREAEKLAERLNSLIV